MCSTNASAISMNFGSVWSRLPLRIDKRTFSCSTLGFMNYSLRVVYPKIASLTNSSLTKVLNHSELWRSKSIAPTNKGVYDFAKLTWKELSFVELVLILSIVAL